MHSFRTAVQHFLERPVFQAVMPATGRVRRIRSAIGTTSRCPQSKGEAVNRVVNTQRQYQFYFGARTHSNNPDGQISSPQVPLGEGVAGAEL